MPSAKSNAGLVWIDRSLFKSVPVFAVSLDRVISGVMEYEANEAQNFMRTNASWTDQTANARQGLFARYVGGSGAKHVIVLYHTMPYGIYLELKHAGKYKIIMPATEQAGRDVMSSLNKAMAMMPRG